jgi:hypothetical protein
MVLEVNRLFVAAEMTDDGGRDGPPRAALVVEEGQRRLGRDVIIVAVTERRPWGPL